MSQLKTERDRGWLPLWRDISDYIAPDMGRWNLSDANEGKRRDQRIINSTSRAALKILASGMFSGMTSPSRPWFKLATPDAALMEFGPVKSWLHQAERVMQDVFARSNLYNVLPTLYGELGGFGIGAIACMPDDDEFVRFYNFTVGSYMAATSSRQQVDTLYREFRMTARQMEQQFGRDAMSQAAQSLLSSNPDAWIDVCHAVEPNDKRDSGRPDNRNMPFRSVYWEKGGDSDALLRQSGFQTSPIMVPRWDVNGENVYGHGPGSVALGDTKALQLMEKRKAQMLEKLVNPPMGAPASLRGQRASILPGDITYLDMTNVGQQFAPLHEINPSAYTALRGEIEAHEERINSAFFVDLFLMISSMDDVRTATEIAARKEEKMLMLGPVLERMNDELLDPLIDRVFNLMIEQSSPRWSGLLPGKPLLPPPPQELSGMDLNVEYVSILAQAQKALGVAGIERVVGFAGNLAGIYPDIVDKVDFDQGLDEYAAMLGAPPTMIRSDDAVAEIRKQRAQEQQAEAMNQQMLAGIQGAKLLSETDVSNDNALTALVGQ
nr:portal protein [Stutzerimonas balearica]